MLIFRVFHIIWMQEVETWWAIFGGVCPGMPQNAEEPRQRTYTKNKRTYTTRAAPPTEKPAATADKTPTVGKIVTAGDGAVASTAAAPTTEEPTDEVYKALMAAQEAVAALPETRTRTATTVTIQQSDEINEKGHYDTGDLSREVTIGSYADIIWDMFLSRFY